MTGWREVRLSSSVRWRWRCRRRARNTAPPRPTSAFLTSTCNRISRRRNSESFATCEVYPEAMPNRLANETSPYLLQHKDNPVDWYAWGDEAFAAAREQDKPILLSVGYSACHWCHVMAHESFENDAIAA